jgi:xylulokinase
MGERTPHLDASARAAWVGLTAKHTRAHMVRAVIEGVCYSQRDGLDIIEQMGVPVQSIRISGGGARSPFWRQVLADVLNKRIVLLETQEGSAYGAALLALVGTGAFRSVQEACCATIREMESVEPNQEAARMYQDAHRTYQAIYPALKPVYAQIG